MTYSLAAVLHHPLMTRHHRSFALQAVERKRAEHAQAFARIAEQHAKIAAEQSRLSSLAAHFGAQYHRKRK